MQQNNSIAKVALITGGAKRIGASIAEYLHQLGWNVVIHYHHSQFEAEQLAQNLNKKRENSAFALAADLTQAVYADLIEKIMTHWQRLDAIINNASIFQAFPIEDVNMQQWQQIFATNLAAPFFLAQAAMPYLKKNQGHIINITDTHADGRPIKGYSLYCMSKAALMMQTQSLARELAPEIRVNAVAPGISMWNEDLSAIQKEIISRTPLKRAGYAQEVAKAVAFLLQDANYTTGSTIYVDGGRCVFN